MDQNVSKSPSLILNPSCKEGRKIVNTNKMVIKQTYSTVEYGHIKMLVDIARQPDLIPLDSHEERRILHYQYS